jgi:phage repressor protein C with HTH and peptisase S24 domain
MRRPDRPLTHDWIWRAIDTLAQRNGLTPSGLARRAGLDPTTFNRSKRLTPEGRPRWPSTESIAKILEATGTTLDEFATLQLGDTLGVSFDETEEGEINGVPVVGVVQDAAVTGWEPAIARRRAAGSTAKPGRRRFALAVGDSSLEPVYSVGNTLVVSEAAAPRAGDRVLVKPAGMPVLPRLLVATNPDEIELSAFHGKGRRLAVRRRDIDWMARIVLVRQ